MNIESYATISENAHIQGVALIPRISRNHNLYTKAELERFHGKTVPLNWEHDSSKIIGKVTFSYDPTTETVYYEGDITDPSAALLAKNKLLYTSIEAQPTSVQKVCNGANDCFAMPFGLIPEALALTETPGVPETSVNVMRENINKLFESLHEHTEQDKEYEKKYGASEIIHKTITIPNPNITITTDENSNTLTITTAGENESMDGVGDSSDLTQKILDYLNLEICEECGDLHLKKKNK